MSEATTRERFRYPPSTPSLNSLTRLRSCPILACALLMRGGILRSLKLTLRPICPWPLLPLERFERFDRAPGLAPRAEANDALPE